MKKLWIIIFSVIISCSTQTSVEPKEIDQLIKDTEYACNKPNLTKQDKKICCAVLQTLYAQKVNPDITIDELDKLIVKKCGTRAS